MTEELEAHVLKKYENCLDKVQRKSNLCPFCRCSCRIKPQVKKYVEGTEHTIEEMEDQEPYRQR